MKRRKRRLLLKIALICFLTMSVAYAVSQDQISFVEKFETGKVDINLQQLSMTTNGLHEAAAGIVEANRDISYIPRITNMKEDCYVRAKVEVTTDGRQKKDVSGTFIYGLSEDWIERGNYFYYKKVLSHGQQSDIFKGIHLPADWKAEGADSLSVNVTAEAVQSRNFVPDFDSSLPWGAVFLNEVTSSSDCREVNVVKDTSVIEYTSAGKFQCRASDLFNEMKKMMPGDQIKKAVTVKNASSEPLWISLHLTSGNTALTQNMKLKVCYEDHILFDGMMSEICNTEGFAIAAIDSGGSSKLDFCIELPPQAGNETGEIKDDMVWELVAQAADAKPVKTGDTSNLIPYTVLAVIAAGAAVFLVIFRRKEK